MQIFAFVGPIWLSFPMITNILYFFQILLRSKGVYWVAAKYVKVVHLYTLLIN